MSDKNRKKDTANTQELDDGQLEDASGGIKYTMFLNDGTPVRARAKDTTSDAESLENLKE